MKKWLVILGTTALLAACTAEEPTDQTTENSQNETTTEQNDTNNKEQAATNDTKKDEDKAATAAKDDSTLKLEEEKKVEDKQEQTKKEEQQAKLEKVDFTKYFLQNGKKAFYLGEGIEFATYNVQTNWLNDKYVQHIQDDGAVLVQRIYRITDTAIEVVVDETIQGDKLETPSIEWLDNVKAMDTLLKAPLKKGTTFGNWEITDTNATVETPLQTFKNVIVVEDKEEDYLDTRYYAEGFGEIKSIYHMQMEENEEYNIVSTLEKVQ